MTTVHISPSEEKVYIEHLIHGNLVLSPEEAWSIYQGLKERQSDLWSLVAKRQVRMLAGKPVDPVGKEGEK